jgi:hypothetical protein
MNVAAHVDAVFAAAFNVCDGSPNKLYAGPDAGYRICFLSCFHCICGALFGVNYSFRSRNINCR